MGNNGFEDGKKTIRFTSKKQEKAVLVLAALAIVINFVCIPLGSVCLNRIRHSKQNFQKSGIPEGYLACIPCENLTTSLGISLSDPLLSQLSIEEAADKELCCAKSSEQLSALIKLVLSPPEQKEEPLPIFDPANFTFSKFSSQRRLWPSSLKKDLRVPLFDKHEANQLLFPPRKLDPLVEHNRGIEVMATQMVITHPGYYYIYSNIIFKPDSYLPCKDYDKQTWEHDVILTRDGDRFVSGIILQSTHTCCDNCRREIATSFTGGVLYLEELDKLHVEVSGYGLVSYRKEGSYFGLYMLGEDDQGFRR